MLSCLRFAHALFQWDCCLLLDHEILLCVIVIIPGSHHYSNPSLVFFNSGGDHIHGHSPSLHFLVLWVQESHQVLGPPIAGCDRHFKAPQVCFPGGFYCTHHPGRFERVRRSELLIPPLTNRQTGGTLSQSLQRTFVPVSSL